MAHEYVYWNQDHSDKSYGGGSEEGNTHHHTAPRTEEWSKGPVMVDGQGRKRPVMLFNPAGNTETYVTTETVVERFVPAVTEYKYSYPMRTEEKVGEEHKYRYPVRMEYKLCSPGKGDEQKYAYPGRVEYYKRSSPVKVEEYRHSSPPPGVVEQRVTKIQTEVTQAPGGPLTALNWRQARAPTGDGKKATHINGVSRSDSFEDDEYYRRNEGGGKHGEWAKAPYSNLTRPTSDIGAAVELLKEVVMPSSGHHVRFSGRAPAGPNYIDSKRAEEKYKGANIG